MTATVIPKRFYNGYRFADAGSITPAQDDKIALADASSSDVRSKQTLFTMLQTLRRIRTRERFLLRSDCTIDPSLVTDPHFAVLSTGTGAALTSQANDTQNRVGVIRATTGSTAAGAVYFSSALDFAIRLGAAKWYYEADVNITTLSTSAEGYYLLCGMFRTDLLQIVCFSYDERGTFGTGQTYWQTVTSAAGTATVNANHTQVTVAAATWYRLGIEINAAANEVKFYIDGVLKATHTTNIPTASGGQMGIAILFAKTVGSTARTLDIDTQLAMAEFSSARGS